MKRIGVKVQNLRQFTVGIRNTKSDKSVGTGIIASKEGVILTCAHVVKKAGINPRNGKPIYGFWKSLFLWIKNTFGSKSKNDIGKVIVYFPNYRQYKAVLCLATITTSPPTQYDDDIVLLRLLDGTEPLGHLDIPIFGLADQSNGNHFQSFGFCHLDPYECAWARGIIQGCVPPPKKYRLKCELVQLQTNEIDYGMSGSPVLDIERNLVVGMVTEAYYPHQSPKHQATAWAVDAKILTFEPFHLSVSSFDLPKSEAPKPKTDIKKAKALAAPKELVAWNGAPPLLSEWVGRSRLLLDLNTDWLDEQRHVTGIVGLAGEGKTSLARKWLHTLLSDDITPKPKGIFWWTFSITSTLEEFFEAVLDYMSGGKIDPQKVPSTNMRAQIIGAMLFAGRYVFVLDALEEQLHQEGNQWGFVKNDDLRALLQYFCAGGHQSFCLITSRIPVQDLMQYTSYTQRYLSRLSAAEARELLRNLKVSGDDSVLDKIVDSSDGHALSLCLVGSYLARVCEGDATKMPKIYVPPKARDPYASLDKILDYYENSLEQVDRTFLTIFSVFRSPLKEDAFMKVFRSNMGPQAINAPLVALNEEEFNIIIDRLIGYSILRFDQRTCTYTTHPLIQNYYSQTLARHNPKKVNELHRKIKTYYLEISPTPSTKPTIEELSSLVEGLHHACCAGDFSEALSLYRDRIDQREKWALTHKLGAYETALSLMLELFPNADTAQDPSIHDPKDKGWILNEVGICHMCLGQLTQAGPLFTRSINFRLNVCRDLKKASVGYQNLAELYAHLGDLSNSASAASKALILARDAKDRAIECDSLTWCAWSSHLRGKVDEAQQSFGLADSIRLKHDLNPRYLHTLRDVLYAKHLLRMKKSTEAWRIAKQASSLSEQESWIVLVSQCLLIIGLAAAKNGLYEIARSHFQKAFRLARGTSDRAVLLEVLLARGHSYARYLNNAPAAFRDLDATLDYAIDSSYRIYEVDTRIARAWAYLASNDKNQAYNESQIAKTLSEKMEYHWGKVDVDEILSVLDRVQ